VISDQESGVRKLELSINN